MTPGSSGITACCDTAPDLGRTQSTRAVPGQTERSQPVAHHTIRIHAHWASQEAKRLAALLDKAKEITPVWNGAPVATQEVCRGTEGVIGDLCPRLTAGAARGRSLGSGGRPHASKIKTQNLTPFLGLRNITYQQCSCNWPERWITSELPLSICIGFICFLVWFS